MVTMWQATLSCEKSSFKALATVKQCLLRKVYKQSLSDRRHWLECPFDFIIYHTPLIQFIQLSIQEKQVGYRKIYQSQNERKNRKEQVEREYREKRSIPMDTHSHPWLASLSPLDLSTFYLAWEVFSELRVPSWCSHSSLNFPIVALIFVYCNH